MLDHLSRWTGDAPCIPRTPDLGQRQLFVEFAHPRGPLFEGVDCRTLDEYSDGPEFLGGFDEVRREDVLFGSGFGKVIDCVVHRLFSPRDLLCLDIGPGGMSLDMPDLNPAPAK